MSRRFRAVSGLGGLVVGLVLAAGPPALLTAQVSIQPSIGLRYTTTIVHDSIVAPFDLRPALPPPLPAPPPSRPPGPWAPQPPFASPPTPPHRPTPAPPPVLGRVSPPPA